ncbi:MAG: hypothetical protein J6K29_11605 [Clostridia bacterium]|nr:hypothetical protein [Clostridia bacterium]
MEKLTVSTPYGEETLYQATLDATVEHLATRLILMTESFSALPITAELTEQLLPAAGAAWDHWALNGIAYLELTPECLTGFGFSISLRECPDCPHLATPMECWGLAVAVAERLAKACGARVCPLYLENALGMAVGDLRVTVGVGKA